MLPWQVLLHQLTLLTQSYASFSTNPEHLVVLLVITQTFDVLSKLCVLVFLYKKFEIIGKVLLCNRYHTEKSNTSNSKTHFSMFIRRIPFILSAIYLVVADIIASWMFTEGLLFEISNPLYVIVTSAELALVVLDIYGICFPTNILVVLQLYVMKRDNPESKTILFRIAFVIGISALMKAATVFLFQLNLDPYWSYYMTTFPFALILYEVVNTSWIEMARVSTAMSGTPTKKASI